MAVYSNYVNDNAPEFKLGSEQISFADKLCALLLCLSPVLQHYVGVYKNAGFTALLLICPILFFRTVQTIRSKKINLYCIQAILPLLLYEMYSLLKELSVGNLFYRTFMLFIFFAVSVGCVNIKLVAKYAVSVCDIGSVIIIVQSFLYNLFKYHLRIIPVSLLLDGSDMWIDRAIYGISSGKSYRPSGMFLEPSHFFLYSLPVLTFLLLSKNTGNKRLRSAILISVAMLCSTSGMGVLVTFALWVVYYLFYKERTSEKINLKQILSVRNVLLIAFFLVLAIMAYLFVPVVSTTIDRILVNDSGQSLAIDGRVRLANMLLEQMSHSEMVFGASVISETIEFNMSGFHSTFYRFGIIGLILTYCFYGQGLFKLKGGYFYFSFIILTISYFSAHTHGTFYMLYYVLFLMNGYYKKSFTIPRR